MNEKFKNKIIIAGPCSAESEQQLDEVLEGLQEVDLYAFRAGVWKPRTRPNGFEGKGAKALDWIANIEKKFQCPAISEVATCEHVENILQRGLSKVWIGARTTSNPFAVQEIADALQGNQEIEVFVKNPINPDINLWRGAVERIENAGIQKIGLIHRGFSVVGHHSYRNVPIWKIPLDMMAVFPTYPMLVDPSHIAGKSDLLPEIIQKAMDLAFNGMMIETHPNPDEALSDPEQQITPQKLIAILSNTTIRQEDSSAAEESLESLRFQMDQVDEDLLEHVRQRMDLAQKIAQYKKLHNITIYQKERWEEIRKTRTQIAQKMNLSESFIRPYLDALHQESIRQQTEIMNPKSEQGAARDY